MYVLVAGGGKVGFHLAQELLESNNEVLIIERDLVAPPPLRTKSATSCSTATAAR